MHGAVSAGFVEAASLKTVHVHTGVNGYKRIVPDASLMYAENEQPRMPQITMDKMSL